MAAEKRGFIAFFATYRPPVPLDIYSCPLEPPPASIDDEIHLTDHQELNSDNYNYNGQQIPPAALKTILSRPELVSQGIYNDSDVDSGRLSGFLFVSERGDFELETLHVALRFNDNTQPKVKVFSLADIHGTATFSGVRMEDSGCIAGDYLIYVTTKDPAPRRRQPWTAVYKTNLKTGETERLTPQGEADLSPSVSPSGRKIAVASFEGKDRGWDGEIENLQTNIYVFDIDNPIQSRYKVVADAGWPTWGGEHVLFFHRKVGDYWGVFRADIGGCLVSSVRITPDDISAITPAAINDTTVAVATIRQESKFTDVRVEDQYRHIEIFEYSATSEKVSNVKITQNTRPLADHFNPFVIDVAGENKRIGYHRCRTVQSGDDIPRRFHKLESADPATELVRVPGVFPTFSEDGSKLAFVDNEFKAVWLADEFGLRVVYDAGKPNSLFAPVWNRSPEKDTLYVCVGPAFSPKDKLDIAAIINVSTDTNPQLKTLTTGDFNNAFASTNREGTKLVFRSTRDGGDKKFKNLYIMHAQSGEKGYLTRLTDGKWIDTHCQWSPNGDWIVFSSSRDNPHGEDQTLPQNLDNGLDPGYFAVYLVNANDPMLTAVRVVGSGYDLAGHVNHPFFSPDGKSIVVTSDLAAVSVDPISLPLFSHSVRPYGDIFIVDIDSNDISKNKDLKTFRRVTHSRFEYSTISWTRMFPPVDMDAQWNLQRYIGQFFAPTCPYVHPGGGESWHMTGQLCIPKRDC